jgi:hypothetical protein
MESPDSGSDDALRRQSSKVEAVSVSRARTVLCGGCRATGIPTATATCFGSNFLSPLFNAQAAHDPRNCTNIAGSFSFAASLATEQSSVRWLESAAIHNAEKPFSLGLTCFSDCDSFLQD